MKRSGFITRTAPLKRTGFSRKASPIRIESDKFTASVKVKRMKGRPKRPTVAEGSKYLEACRGEACYLRVVCGGLASPDIVVPCHSNQSRDGKGMGKKAAHEKSVPGCHWCHQWLDQGPAPREEKFAVWDRGYAEWEPVRARKMGINQPLEEVV